MKDIILKIENVSKQYRLGVVGTGTLSHDLNRAWNKLRGKPDPYAKVGMVNDRSSKAKGEYVWALRDINFEVRRGEVLGVIGKNGAGKSTLLKILSRVTGPTEGTIKSNGRIASLLEVGTGFHPELTGRENVFLNGAILGMTKAEVEEKLEEIISFSGCEMYIDTPTKRYSSGMRVRLAFAVAAHLEPDILVIDEVLAVGDAEFQKKAIGKMQDISKGEGRTVIFVSHDMAAVNNLCSRVIVLANGTEAFNGGTEDAINFYINQSKKQLFHKIENKSIGINDIYLKTNNLKSKVGILGKSFSLHFLYESKININKLVIRIILRDALGKSLVLFNNYHSHKPFSIKSGAGEFSVHLAKLPVYAGEYNISLLLLNLETKETYLDEDFVFTFDVEDGDFYKSGKLPSTKEKGLLAVDHKWTIN